MSNGVSAHNGTAQAILTYLPLVLIALETAFKIHADAKHQKVAQTVTDAINAGADIGMEVPEAHVQLVAGIVHAVAPTVAGLVKQAIAAAQPPVPVAIDPQQLSQTVAIAPGAVVIAPGEEIITGKPDPA